MRYSLNPLDRWDAQVHYQTGSPTGYTDQYGIWWRGGPPAQPKPQPAFQPPGTPLESQFSQPGQPTSFDPGPDIGSILGGGDAGVGGGIGGGDLWDDVGGYVPTYDPTYSRPLPGDFVNLPAGTFNYIPMSTGYDYVQQPTNIGKGEAAGTAEANRSGRGGDSAGRYGGTGPINVGAGEERRAAQQQAQQNQVVRNEVLRQLLSGGFGGSLFRPLPNLQMPNATQSAIDRARREMGRTQLARAEEAAATGRAGSSLLSQQQADLDRAFLEAVGGIEAEQVGREFGLRGQQQQLEYARQVAEAQAQWRQLQVMAGLLGGG